MLGWPGLPFLFNWRKAIITTSVLAKIMIVMYCQIAAVYLRRVIMASRRQVTRSTISHSGSWGSGCVKKNMAWKQKVCLLLAKGPEEADRRFKGRNVATPANSLFVRHGQIQQGGDGSNKTHSLPYYPCAISGVLNWRMALRFHMVLRFVGNASCVEDKVCKVTWLKYWFRRRCHWSVWDG